MRNCFRAASWALGALTVPGLTFTRGLVSEQGYESTRVQTGQPPPGAGSREELASARPRVDHTLMRLAGQTSRCQPASGGQAKVLNLRLISFALLLGLSRRLGSGVGTRGPRRGSCEVQIGRAHV